MITQVQLKKQVEPSFQSPRRMNHHNPNLRMSGVRLARVRQVDWANRAGRGKGGARNLAGFSWFWYFCFSYFFLYLYFEQEAQQMPVRFIDLFVFQAGNLPGLNHRSYGGQCSCMKTSTQLISGCLDLTLRRRGGWGGVSGWAGYDGDGGLGDKDFYDVDNDEGKVGEWRWW